MDFRESIDIEGKQVRAHEIEALEPQKRLRVLGGWLLDSVFEDINCFNHINRVKAYLKQLGNMRKAYPIHERHIDEINIDLWARYQEKFKSVIKPQINILRRKQIKEDLKRMGF